MNAGSSQTLAGAGAPTAVQVAVRVRSLTAKELLASCCDCVQVYDRDVGPAKASVGMDADEDEPSGAPRTASQYLKVGDKVFAFDHVFRKEHSQADVYDSVMRGLLGKFLQGFNATILAYGQTGSGKTYSMGTGLDTGSADSQTHMGIVPRAIHELFAALGDRRGREPGFSCEVSVSFLELYNEELLDLLNPASGGALLGSGRPGTASGGAPAALQIRENGAGGLVWRGATVRPCATAQEVLGLLQQGSLCRATGSTDMNMTSSRSHAIFCVMLRQATDDGLPATVAKLNFVDLAGSERLKRTNASGERAREGISINAGLLALGNVIAALAEDARHVPYRDSKLTRILQDSLGGNSHTVMLACVSPSDSNVNETVNTLRYADRAKSIKNRAMINAEWCDGAGAGSLRELERENRQLRALVDSLRAQFSGDGALGESAGLSTRGLLFYQQQQRQLDLSQEQTQHISGELADLRRQVETAATEMRRLVFAKRRYRRRAAASERARCLLEQRLAQGSGAPDASVESAAEQIASLRLELAGLQDRLAWQDEMLSASASPGLGPGHDARARAVSASSGLSTAPSDASAAFSNEGEGDDGPRGDAATDEASSSDPSESDDDHLDVSRDEDDDGEDEQRQAEEEHDGTFRMLHQLQKDILAKEELLHQLERSQLDYAAMKRKYDEKLTLLQSSLVLVQQERDTAVSRIAAAAAVAGRGGGNPAAAAAAATEEKARARHERKIRKLTREIEAIRRKHEDTSRAMTLSRQQNEGTIRSMRTSIEALKDEKTRLVKQLHSESERLKKLRARNERELGTLRRKELATMQLARRLERANKAQLALLERRSEQVLHTRKENRKLKSVMAILKRQNTPNPITKAVRHGAAGRAVARSLSATSLASAASSSRPLENPPKGPTLRNGQKSPAHAVAADRRAIFKKQLLDREIAGCVEALQIKQALDALLYKSRRLDEEQRELQAERESVIAAETARLGRPCDPEQPQYMDDRLEAIAEEARVLARRILELRDQLVVQGFANVLSRAYGPAFLDGEPVVSNLTFFDQYAAGARDSDPAQFGFENAASLLKALDADEMEQLSELVLADLVVARVAESARLTAITSLESSNAELRRTARTLRRVLDQQQAAGGGNVAGVDALATRLQASSLAAASPAAAPPPRALSDGELAGKPLPALPRGANFVTCSASPLFADSALPTPVLAGRPVRRSPGGDAGARTAPTAPLALDGKTRSGAVYRRTPELPGPDFWPLGPLGPLGGPAAAAEPAGSLGAHGSALAVNVYDRLSSTHTVSSLQKVRESIAAGRGSLPQSIDHVGMLDQAGAGSVLGLSLDGGGASGDAR